MGQLDRDTLMLRARVLRGSLRCVTLNAGKLLCADFEWVCHAAVLRAVFGIVLIVAPSFGWAATELPELVSQVGHNEKIQALIFSRDGKRLVSAAADNSLRIWDVESGRTLISVIIRGMREGGAALSPTNNIVAVRTATEIVLWNWAENKITAKAPIREGKVIAFSANGLALLTGNFDGSVELRDGGSLTVSRVIRAAGAVSALAMSEHNTLLAIGSYDSRNGDGRLTLIELNKTKRRCRRGRRWCAGPGYLASIKEAKQTDQTRMSGGTNRRKSSVR
jgi:Anaphase-promoting complex subunit 4 WD40 domain